MPRRTESARRLRSSAAEPFYRFLKAFFDTHSWGPSEKAFRLSYIRPTAFRVIEQALFEHNLTAAARATDDHLGQVENGVLLRIPYVDRAVHLGDGELIDPLDQVRYVAETPCLSAIPVDRHRLVADRLTDEGRDHPAVVPSHPRPVGVEDARDLRVGAMGLMVGHHHRLRESLCLVIDASGTDWIDVSPVVFRLRMDQGIAIDLRC